MFRKILVPTDGSEAALQAAKYAKAMAEKFGSEVTLVHVVQNYYSLPAFSLADTVTIPVSVLQDLESTGKVILNKTEDIFQDFTGGLSSRLEFGPPGKQIIDIAVKEKFELIVMGRRGLSGVTGMLLGSVSNHIVHYSPCPTLIVKGIEPLP